MSLLPLLSISVAGTPSQVETNGRLVIVAFPSDPLVQTNVVQTYFVEDGASRLLWSIPSEAEWEGTQFAVDKDYAHVLVWDRSVDNSSLIRVRLYTVGGVLLATQEITGVPGPIAGGFAYNYALLYNGSTLHFFTLPTLSEFLTATVQGAALDLATFRDKCQEYVALFATNEAGNVALWIYTLPRLGRLGISLGAPLLLDQTSFPATGFGSVTSYKNLLALSTDQARVALLTLCEGHLEPLSLSGATGALLDVVLLKGYLVTAEEGNLFLFRVGDGNCLKLVETIPAVAPISALGGQRNFLVVAYDSLVYLYRICG